MQNNEYQIYKAAIKKVITNEEQLPSLPSITLKIRRAINDPLVDYLALSKLIRLDPSLSTILFKYAASPFYKRAVTPKTIEDIISMMGMKSVTNLIMLHSVRSLFVLKNPKLKKLFELEWRRIIFKAATTQFLAQKLDFRDTEEAMMASLLTEVGTLTILSTFSTDLPIPSVKTYRLLCKKYSRSLGAILLKKWGLDHYHIDILRTYGDFNVSRSQLINLIDIINLSIFATEQQQNTIQQLPPFEKTVLYQKLPFEFREMNHRGELVVISANRKQIKEIIHAYSFT